MMGPKRFRCRVQNNDFGFMFNAIEKNRCKIVNIVWSKQALVYVATNNGFRDFGVGRYLISFLCLNFSNGFSLVLSIQMSVHKLCKQNEILKDL